ncbi:DUF2268 domain-containing putative Zn-dependent protease [Chloroflexota bacterium]
MSVKIHILDASGNLKSQRDLLRNFARLTVKKVQRKLALNDIDIVIREAEKPEIYKDIDGVGGYCPGGHFVQLSIDVNHPSFRTSSGKIFETTLIHELHHAARMQAGVLMNQGSFLEFLFSEGLADYFVYELTGNSGKWVTAISQKDKIRLLKKAEQKSGDKFTDQDHRDWFVEGASSQRIPRFAGYAIGFELVKDYLTKNPDKSAASLVKTPVLELLPLSFN